MKILLTNLHLVNPLGSEIWTWTIAKELLRRKYKVDVFTSKKGPWLNYMVSKGVGTISISRRNRSRLRLKYDLIISNHSFELNRSCNFISKVNSDKIILMTHGRGSLETPLNLDSENIKKVAISKETFDFRKKEGFKIDSIIPNPVDQQWFDLSVAKEFKEVLWGNHRHECPYLLKFYLSKAGIKLIGPFRKFPPERIIKEISNCGMVFGTGRWIYENMPSKICIIADSNNNLGWINKDNYEYIQDYNMTSRAIAGKASNLDLSWEKMIDKLFSLELNLIIEETRQIALDKLHSKVIVDSLLSL